MISQADSGHGSRFTAEAVRLVTSPSAPSLSPTLGQKSTLDYTEDYGYDPLYRLTRADRTNPGATPPNQWTWGYDAVGNRTSAQKDQEATTSTHNEKNQLLSTTGGGKMLWRGVLDEPGIATFNAASASINGQPARMLAGNVFEATLDLPAGANTVTIQAQDGSGNVSSKSYSVNVLGVPATYTYDANGNLATKTEGADAWVYTWNALGQMTSVAKNGVSQASYEYDPVGRRIRRTAGTTTSWLYDSEDVIQEVAGSASTAIVHGLGIDEPLALQSGMNTTYLHTDGMGSVTLQTTSAGAIGQVVAYSVWGEAQSGTAGPFGFVGREWDEFASMWYFRARWYDASLGRFISEDPIEFGGGMNFFAYAGNDPAGAIDPFGLSPQSGGVIGDLTNNLRRRNNFHRDDNATRDLSKSGTMEGIRQQFRDGACFGSDYCGKFDVPEFLKTHSLVGHFVGGFCATLIPLNGDDVLVVARDPKDTQTATRIPPFLGGTNRENCSLETIAMGRCSNPWRLPKSVFEPHWRSWNYFVWTEKIKCPTCG